MILPDFRNAVTTGKKIFIRSDLDVPLTSQVNSSNMRIADDMRLVESMQTIQYLLKQQSMLIIGGHVGRPEGKTDLSLSTLPIAKWYADHLMQASVEKEIFGGFEGWRVSPNLFILENLRFFPGEEQNDVTFSKKLSLLADMYVNDAFAMSHRAHASVVGITQFLPHYAGIRLLEEIGVLSKIIETPQHPLVVIIGGKKIETKLPLIKHMQDLADYVLVGGKIAQEPLTEHTNVSKSAATIVVGDTNEKKDDITEQSIEKFVSIIKDAKMIVWNGPVGLIQAMPSPSEDGTLRIATAIASSHAFSVVGGGDTVEYIRRIGLGEKFSFISTGGGAMLTFLSGKQLPGLTALLQ